jgi:hypothetical protein
MSPLVSSSRYFSAARLLTGGIGLIFHAISGREGAVKGRESSEARIAALA